MIVFVILFVGDWIGKPQLSQFLIEFQFSSMKAKMKVTFSVSIVFSSVSALSSNYEFQQNMTNWCYRLLIWKKLFKWKKKTKSNEMYAYSKLNRRYEENWWKNHRTCNCATGLSCSAKTCNSNNSLTRWWFWLTRLTDAHKLYLNIIVSQLTGRLNLWHEPYNLTLLKISLEL